MTFLKMIRQLAVAYQGFDSISSKHIRTLGLTPSQFDVIATLGNQPPMTCSELAERTLMVKGNLTVVLNGLTKKNLIKKYANPNDGRSMIIALTTKGEKIFKEAFEAHLKHLEPLMKSFSTKEIEKLIKHLTNFNQKISSYS